MSAEQCERLQASQALSACEVHLAIRANDVEIKSCKIMDTTGYFSPFGIPLLVIKIL